MVKCNEEMQVFQRCVGYYSSRHTVNKGKLEEIKTRKTYDINKAVAKCDEEEKKSLLTADS